MSRHKHRREEHAAPASALPLAIRLTSTYGYITDDGVQRGWPADCVVTDPDEIAELTSRGAPLVEVSHVD